MIRKLITLAVSILLSAALGLPGFAQDPSENLTGFAEAYAYLSALGSRAEGSAQEKTAVRYITDFLTERGVRFEVSDFGDLVSAHSYSTSIHTYFRGTSNDELLVIVPLNSRDGNQGTANGALNIALGLALADLNARIAPRLSLRILFLGAEFGNGNAYPIGSRSFLSSYFPEGVSAAVYLDFDVPPEKIIFRTGDRGYVAPYWMMERCLESLDTSYLPYSLQGNERQFFRLGAASNPAPLVPYLAAGYPAVSFHGSGSIADANEAWMWADAFIDVISGLLQYNGNPTEWDRHYLALKSGRISVIIQERTYLIIIISAIVLLLAYPLVLSRRFLNYAGSIARNFWALPMLLILVFLLLLLGTFLIEGLSFLKGYPDYWTRHPALIFLLKIMTAVFLFSLISQRVRRIHFPRRGRFYSAAALLILMSDIIILGIMDISLAYYMVWASLWAFLFSLAPNRILKTICLILSPVWLGKAAYDILTIPAMEIARELILARTSGNLLVAFIIFPFLLMLIRLDFMFRHPRKKTKRLLVTVTYITLGLGCGGLTLALAINAPFDERDPQPVEIHEVQNLDTQTSYVEVKSPAALRSLMIQSDSGNQTMDSRTGVYTLEAPLRPDLVTTRLSTSRFLGRTTHTLIVESRGMPVLVALTLESDDDFTMYDSSFPYTFLSSKEVEVFVGKNPPNPLAVEFTVPESLRGTIVVTASFTNPPTSYAVTGENISTTRRMTVNTRVSFGPN